jgi:hypothetical protein
MDKKQPMSRGSCGASSCYIKAQSVRGIRTSSSCHVNTLLKFRFSSLPQKRRGDGRKRQTEVERGHLMAGEGRGEKWRREDERK